MSNIIENELREWLGKAYIQEITESFDGEYQQGFKDGEKKAIRVLDLFSKEVPSELHKSFAYISIGGADGAECIYALTHSEIPKAVLLEYSMEGAAEARRKAEEQLPQGKKLVVYEGDATQKLNDALPLLESWRKNEGLTGILVSCQGILHELPYRSPNYDYTTFFGSLFRGWKNIVFVAREPCGPDRWDGDVQMKVGNLSDKVLAGVADIIAKHQRFEGRITPVCGGYVQMPARLAAECLFKLVFFNKIERLNYEMQESLTSFDPEAFSQFLAKDLNPSSCHLVRASSDNFIKHYNKMGIQLRDPKNGNILLPPNLHATVTGSRLAACMAESEHPAPEAKPEHSEPNASRPKPTVPPAKSNDANQINDLGNVSGGKISFNCTASSYGGGRQINIANEVRGDVVNFNVGDNSGK